MRLPEQNNRRTPMANPEAGAQLKDLRNAASIHVSVTSNVSLADLGEEDTLDPIIAQLQKDASSHISPDISRFMTALQGSKGLSRDSLAALWRRLISVQRAINAICSPTPQTADQQRSIEELEPNLRLTRKLCLTLAQINSPVDGAHPTHEAALGRAPYSFESSLNLVQLTSLIDRFGRDPNVGEPFRFDDRLGRHSNEHFVSALFVAIKARSSSAIITQLIAQGEDPFFEDKTRCSLLMHAAVVGDPWDPLQSHTGSLDKVKALTAGMAADEITLKALSDALIHSTRRLEYLRRAIDEVPRETLTRWLPAQEEIVSYLETIRLEVISAWQQNNLPALRHLSFPAFINPNFVEGHEGDQPGVPQDYMQKIEHYLTEGIDFNADIGKLYHVDLKMITETQMQPLAEIAFHDLNSLSWKVHYHLPFIISNMTALGCATRYGQPLLVQALLDRGATTQGPAFGHHPFSVLCYAACADAREYFRYMPPFTAGSVDLLAVFLDSSNDLGLTREHVAMALDVAQRWQQKVLFEAGGVVPDFAAKQGAIIAYLQTKLEAYALVEQFPHPAI